MVQTIRFCEGCENPNSSRDFGFCRNHGGGMDLTGEYRGNLPELPEMEPLTNFLWDRLHKVSIMAG